MSESVAQQTFQGQQQPQRKVSFLLGLGIFLFPLIFVWFTLRAGHTTLSRVISFIWLVLSLIVVFSMPSADQNINTVQSSQTKQTALVTDNNEQEDEQLSAESAPALIQVSAQELFRNYEANEVAADRNFKGQSIEISGSVQSIESGLGDGANIQFNVGDEYGLHSVTASGDSSFDNFAASLSKGQNVTLQCIGAGEIVGQPLLSDCKPI